MKLYLSSYKIGDKAEVLRDMFAESGNKIGYIPNALDFSSANIERVKEHIQADIASLKELGIDVELLDLKNYFEKENDLRTKIDSLDGVWVSGGNVFVLRQAMRLSGLDTILQEMDRNEFVYGGYSAAGCVLSPRLDAYQIVDDATDTPYAELPDVIWDGLGLIDYAFLPHYDSDHPESEDIAKEVEFCEQEDVAYKTLRDGEVIIVDTSTS